MRLSPVALPADLLVILPVVHPVAPPVVDGIRKRHEALMKTARYTAGVGVLLMARRLGLQIEHRGQDYTIRAKGGE